MSNKVLIGVCFTLCVAGCANSPSAPSAAKAAADAESPVGCVPVTATRIPPSPHECGAFGRAWKQEDIKTTGATDAGQALRLLDPSVTVAGR